jgi:hypothetical protein
MDAVADEEVASTHVDEYRYFCGRLFESFGKRDPAGFDRWLKIEGEHGFLRLLRDHHRLRDYARQEARELAQTFYRLQLWGAFQTMSRAYGALMLTIWLDLVEDQDLRPSHAEERIFRGMHLPQFHLGGLPLAFFTNTQLHWIYTLLSDFWERECLDAEDYDPVAQLLGYYGTIVSERRSVDRNLKAEHRARARTGARGIAAGAGGTGLEASEGESAELDHAEDFPEITSPSCQTCGGRLQLVGDHETLDQWTLVQLQCGLCDREPWYARIDLTRWTGRS